MYKVIGIPRSIHYYYNGLIWKTFLEKLGFKVIISPKTNKEIMNYGIKYATDEMCLSLKNYIGHVAYLKDKCDYILIPRIDNYGIDNQTCTNFLALYDIVNNLFDINILNYNIDLNNNNTEEMAFKKIGIDLGKNNREINMAYKIAKKEFNNKRNKLINENIKKLNSDNKKILLVGHPYNLYDSYIGTPIIKYLNKYNIEIIYSDLFDSNVTNKLGNEISSQLYWKYSKENLGAITLTKNLIDGVVFLTTFPCGLDSLTNELVMRKLNIPYLNLIVDDLDSMTGYETRIESFIDIIERKEKYV